MYLRTSSWLPQAFQNRAWGLQNQVLRPLKWSPEASKIESEGSKIEPGAVQDGVFKEFELKKAQKEHSANTEIHLGTILAPIWRPKTLQNRGRNPKKSMLKNKPFLASIFQGFGPRFGRVLGWFFGPKMHENCENTNLPKTLKIVIVLRENWYFQGFDYLNFLKKC